MAQAILAADGKQQQNKYVFQGITDLNIYSIMSTLIQAVVQ